MEWAKGCSRLTHGWAATTVKTAKPGLSGSPVLTPTLAVFQLALSRCAAVAQALLGESFSGVVISDRYSAYSWLPLERRQICWAHLKRDLTAIAERCGVSAEVGGRLLELEQPELVAPTNDAAECALRPAVIHRRLSYGVQSTRGGLCHSRLLTVTTTLRQQGRDVLQFLVDAWEAHRDDQPSPSLLPQHNN